MAQLLDVPYRSQWDDDATQSSSDCGPACLAMILGYYGVQARIDDLFEATGAPPGGYVGLNPLRQIGQAYGLELACSADNSLTDLKGWLDEGKPALVLVQYRSWSRHSPPLTQDDFEGPHYVVAVGYDERGHVVVNDPNYWGERRYEGYRRAYPEPLFSQAWHDLDPPNPPGAALVPLSGERPTMVTPVLCVVGKSGSGKTTLVEKLIRELKRRGYRVNSVKHHVHQDFEIDVPGKDSWRHAQAGADGVAVVAPNKTAVIRRTARELSLAAVAEMLGPADILIVEGYRWAPLPKIEVVRAAHTQAPVCPPGELLGLVSDLPLELGVPRFDLDDVDALADWVAERFLG